ncbi:FAD-dependent monooxygenase phnB [Pseudocercospora fuligena]|uniref:FAD-dependent monooxygenase phnB n=1 Tax=Pseudocercospora fuligena TaxID=685502 RepID=A0A8H6RUT7_9PEZI|nr:FAD-dependent monooxygenase phnB [Pseudocercospora fuligena]
MSSEQHILIIGAGLTGLAIAHGLNQAKISYTIFEAEEKTAFRPREWTMALHWSIPMLKSLLPPDLASRFESEASVDPSLDYTKYPNNSVPIYDGLTGEVVREIDSAGVRVSRRKLRTLLAEGIEIQWGHKLTSINHDSTSKKVTAIFSNGQQHTGTLLIGADGGKSPVRTHIFGPTNAKTTPLELAYTNNSFRYSTPSQALHARTANPVTAMCAHPVANVMLSMQDVPDPSDPSTWTSQVIFMSKKSTTNTSSTLPNSARHAELKEKGAQFPEPFKSAILNMPESVEIQYQELGYWIPPTTPWDTHHGTVTLAGDAAHSMPPHRGQGLNNALNDAFNFVEVVKEIGKGGDQVVLIQKYSQEVAERGGKEVELSVKTAELLSNFETFRESALVKQGLAKPE